MAAECLKCNTPNPGICYWWCEELKDKIHPKLLAEFKANAEALAASKKFWPKLKAKLLSYLPKRRRK